MRKYFRGHLTVNILGCRGIYYTVAAIYRQAVWHTRVLHSHYTVANRLSGIQESCMIITLLQTGCLVYRNPARSRTVADRLSGIQESCTFIFFKSAIRQSGDTTSRVQTANYAASSRLVRILVQCILLKMTLSSCSSSSIYSCIN